MKYEWLPVGDQDARIRRICPLGPWMLEVTEAYWRGEKLFMRGYAYRWDDEAEHYVPLEEVECGECDRNKTAEKTMEDWFALNVLSERYFTGGKHEQDNQ